MVPSLPLFLFHSYCLSGFSYSIFFLFFSFYFITSELTLNLIVFTPIFVYSALKMRRTGSCVSKETKCSVCVSFALTKKVKGKRFSISYKNF